MKLTGLRDGVGDSGHVFGDDLEKETVLRDGNGGGGQGGTQKKKKMG